MGGSEVGDSDSGSVLFFFLLTTTSDSETTMANTNLEDVPSLDLMTELLRRFKCSSKPDKRLILVGIYLHLSIYILKFDIKLSVLCSLLIQIRKFENACVI